MIFKEHWQNTVNMKTRITLLIVVIGLLHLTSAAANMNSDRSRSNKSSLLESFSGDRSSLTRAAEERGLMININPNENGLTEVMVKSNIGLTLLKGQYLNRDLSVPHGEFTYYHPNGRLESKGRYDHGVKSGSWVRYDLSGNELSVREYSGMRSEELKEAAGIYSMARSK